MAVQVADSGTALNHLASLAGSLPSPLPPSFWLSSLMILPRDGRP